MKRLSFARKEKIVSLLNARFSNDKRIVATFLGFLVKSKWNEIADTRKSDDEVLAFVNSLKITFEEYLACAPLNDVHLVHNKIDNEPATIVELHSGTLTEAGKEAWSDVLKAEYISTYDGIYGTQIELKGVKASRLDAFSMMLAGHCSTKDYERWVSTDSKSGTG